MTLALIFLAISCTIATPPARAQGQSESQSTPVNAIQATPEKQNQTTDSQPQQSPPTANPPAAPPAQTPSSKPSSTAKHRLHKKKAASSNCGVAPAPSGSAADPNSTSPTTADPSTTGTSAQNSGNAAPTNCPPTKVVVPHGGTSEPSIQLAGGPTADQAAKQRQVVDQLLGVTETNLKKIAGQQLSSSQQDTLAQSRAFVKQSKDAVESGDLDRARNLAWKAELLSEDLLKPQK